MATRFHLPASESTVLASPTPSSFSWTGVADFKRAKSGPVAAADTMTTVSIANAVTPILYRQYVTHCLTPGQTITASQAIKAQCRIRSPSGVAACWVLKLYVQRAGLNGEESGPLLVALRQNITSVDGSSLVNRSITGTTSVVGYTTKAGDRLVLEIGITRPNGTGHSDLASSEMRLGYTSSGWLPEDDTSTSDLSPWFELSDTLTFSEYLPADPADVIITGQAATFSRTRVLQADSGSLSLSGQSAEFAKGYYFTPEAGLLVLSGQAAEFSRTRVLEADAGAFEISSQAIDFGRSYDLDAQSGSFSITGQGAEFSITSPRIKPVADSASNDNAFVQYPATATQWPKADDPVDAPDSSDYLSMALPTIGQGGAGLVVLGEFPEVRPGSIRLRIYAQTITADYCGLVGVHLKDGATQVAYYAGPAVTITNTAAVYSLPMTMHGSAYSGGRLELELDFVCWDVAGSVRVYAIEAVTGDAPDSQLAGFFLMMCGPQL